MVPVFSNLFNPNKYLGVDINKNFIRVSKIKNQKYRYRILEKDYLEVMKEKLT